MLKSDRLYLNKRFIKRLAINKKNKIIGNKNLKIIKNSNIETFLIIIKKNN